MKRYFLKILSKILTPYTYFTKYECYFAFIIQVPYPMPANPSYLIVIGSSNTDMIIKVERIPQPGESILGGRYSIAHGGKGANQAVAAARSGAKVVFVGCVGEDDLGEKAISSLKKDGVETRYIMRTQKEPSGVALIIVDQQGENSIAVASGANMCIEPRDIDRLLEVIKRSSLLLLQLEIPLHTVKRAALAAHELSIPVILNPAPAQVLDKELLSVIDILTPNETEAEILTGIRITGTGSATEAGRLLLSKGVKTVIITMGKSGAFLVQEDTTVLIQGFNVNPVDTTAAGDTFNGALAVAISEGKAMHDAVRFANAAAALSVTKLGAQPSLPARLDIERFLEQHQKHS